MSGSRPLTRPPRRANPTWGCQSKLRMESSEDRVLIIGAGPVGLCLALKLAKDGVPSTVIEQLRDDNFLDQVPRAGTNHPATLELYDEIGLYDRLEPRGIIAPLFQYWDRA